QPTHWFGSKAPHEVGQDGEPADGTPSIVSATTPILGMLAMQDTIALIDEVGIDAIRMKSIALTEFAIDLADELLPDARLASPRNSADRGSHITLDIDGSHELGPKLWAQGVIPDFREPGGIRMGLSPLSTSFAEVEVGLWAMRYPSA
ncbi:MAG: kynureninase, partial [Homoserinimonas sp.]|nr:kynureninase [Homoserinimonas sp.]